MSYMVQGCKVGVFQLLQIRKYALMEMQFPVITFSKLDRGQISRGRISATKGSWSLILKGFHISIVVIYSPIFKKI